MPGGPGFAVLCVDLDRFKDVNDGLGHAAGDEVIRQVSQRLRALLRHGDHVARLGGDEFAILQSGVSNPDDVRTLAQRVVDTLAAPYEFQGHPIVCGGSVGAAIYGIDSKTVDDLLHKADLALYRAKAEGRGGFSFYDGAARPPAPGAARTRARPAPGDRIERAGPALPAAVRRRWRHAQRLRGAGALDAPDARLRGAGRLHPGGRRDRLDRGARALGAAPRVRRSRHLARAADAWRSTCRRCSSATMRW